MLPGFSNTPEAVRWYISQTYSIYLTTIYRCCHPSSRCSCLTVCNCLKRKHHCFCSFAAAIWVTQRPVHGLTKMSVGKFLDMPSHKYRWRLTSLSSKSFGEVISFTSKRFQPFWAASFCARFVHRFYVEEGPYPTAMSEILGGDARLGTATDITIVSHVPDTLVGLKKDLYYWAHNTRSPFGIRIPTICPTCHCFSTLSASTPSNHRGKLLRIYCTSHLAGPRCQFEKLVPIKEGRTRGPERLFYGEWFTEPL